MSVAGLVRLFYLHLSELTASHTMIVDKPALRYGQFTANGDENTVDCVSQGAHARDAGKSEQSDQQGVLDQILAVFLYKGPYYGKQFPVFGPHTGFPHEVQLHLYPLQGECDQGKFSLRPLPQRNRSLACRVPTVFRQGLSDGQFSGDGDEC